MTGKVTVTGAPVTPTPTPSATATATATPPTASPTATHDAHATPLPTTSPTATPSGADRTTPAPLGTSRGDVTAPVVSKLKLKAVAHGARVSLHALGALHGHDPLQARQADRAHHQALHPRRRPVVHGAQLTLVRGRYTVEVEARDARGNKAAVQRKNVRVTR